MAASAGITRVAGLSAVTAMRRVAGPVARPGISSGQLAGEERDLVMVADQPQAGRGGGAGLAATEKQGAGSFLERLDALRDGRGGDVQFGRGGLEAAKAVNGGKGGKLGQVEHSDAVALGWRWPGRCPGPRDISAKVKLADLKRSKND
ncbi:hypothetical protein MASR1M32_38020 [Rhodobacter sp.]